ncbi:16S rRNA (guanine(527)-N(7))-methyltransferase RsmG [Thioalkalivibrio sp. HK1]|uniref:16S rRNA (guanine(527)-N(7))-methyltransferase RsmG n=1 Tax=Thioalkalivibrio sp. HK1 TaxID=1469245 RepID=UPI0004B80BC8|nr:16S rRNA (guanine(527)-N(7))-methyltransferase RsmG [Thioalkalivibrio sp. HK1]
MPSLDALESCLEAQAMRSGYKIPTSARLLLARYVLLLAKWNRASNLTSVRDPFSMIERHVLDSLTALESVYGARLLDVGTGAGLPGIVLAIMRPDIHCTLLDSVGKKTRFCAQAVLELGLRNVEVATERLADHRPARSYSTVISRAAMSVAELLAGSKPLIEPPGRIVAMKGPRPLPELDAIEGEGLSIRIEDVRRSEGCPPTTLVSIDIVDGIVSSFGVDPGSVIDGR